jgi:hypothetical protein
MFPPSVNLPQIGALLSGGVKFLTHLQLTFRVCGLNYARSSLSRRAMPRSLGYGGLGPGRSAFRGLAWIVGAVASLAAIVTGAVLALVFAASLVVILLMAGVILTLAAAAVRARRTATVSEAADPELIEARNIGGHSWVAYGWDGRR